MTSPMITALMTTFNSSRYVCQAIDSVLTQTCQDFQLLIVDDASTDKTCQLIENYRDPRIRLIRQPKNLGVGATLANALQYINSPYIAKIDSDDICAPVRFEKQFAFMLANPELDIVKCYFNYFTDDTEVAQSERYRYFKEIKEVEHNSIDTPDVIRDELLRWNCIIHSCYFAKTSVVRDLAYTNSRMGEDYSFFYRAITSGFNIGCVPELLFYVRLSAGSLTTKPESLREFSKVVTDLKLEKLNKLVETHDKLFIYGAGGLAKAIVKELLERKLPFAGFVDRAPNEPILIDGISWPVFHLDTSNKCGLVIAAQPVRKQITEILQAAGWREWQDFIVIA